MDDKEAGKAVYGHNRLQKRLKNGGGGALQENGETAQTNPTSLGGGLFSDGKKKVEPAPRSERPLNDRLEAIEERRRLWIRWARFLLQRDRLYIRPNRTAERNESKD